MTKKVKCSECGKLFGVYDYENQHRHDRNVHGGSALFEEVEVAPRTKTEEVKA